MKTERSRVSVLLAAPPGHVFDYNCDPDERVHVFNRSQTPEMSRSSRPSLSPPSSLIPPSVLCMSSVSLLRPAEPSSVCSSFSPQRNLAGPQPKRSCSGRMLYPTIPLTYAPNVGFTLRVVERNVSSESDRMRNKPPTGGAAALRCRLETGQTQSLSHLASNLNHVFMML